jgi:hypothetical protein
VGARSFGESCLSLRRYCLCPRKAIGVNRAKFIFEFLYSSSCCVAYKVCADQETPLVKLND